MLSIRSVSDCSVCTSTGLCEASQMAGGRHGRARVFTRVGTLLAGVGGEHLLVAPTQQDEIRVGAAQCGEPCRFAFQQRAHFQQVVEGAAAS